MVLRVAVIEEIVPADNPKAALIPNDAPAVRTAEAALITRVTVPIISLTKAFFLAFLS